MPIWLDKYFFPYITTSLNFMPFTTLLSILSLNDTWKYHFAPHAVYMCPRAVWWFFIIFINNYYTIICLIFLWSPHLISDFSFRVAQGPCQRPMPPPLYVLLLLCVLLPMRVGFIYSTRWIHQRKHVHAKLACKLLAGKHAAGWISSRMWSSQYVPHVRTWASASILSIVSRWLGQDRYDHDRTTRQIDRLVYGQSPISSLAFTFVFLRPVALVVVYNTRGTCIYITNLDLTQTY